MICNTIIRRCSSNRDQEIQEELDKARKDLEEVRAGISRIFLRKKELPASSPEKQELTHLLELLSNPVYCPSTRQAAAIKNLLQDILQENAARKAARKNWWTAVTNLSTSIKAYKAAVNGLREEEQETQPLPTLITPVSPSVATIISPTTANMSTANISEPSEQQSIVADESESRV